MADDIEEFLKRVAEKRRGQQGAKPASQQPRPQQQQPAQRPPQQRPPVQQPQQPQPPRPPMTVSPPPVVQRSTSDNISTTPPASSIHDMSLNEVQRHAQDYMSRSEFETRSKQAGMHAKPLAHLESNVAKPRAAREPDTKSTMPREFDVFATAAPVSTDNTESMFAAMMKNREAFRSAFLLSLVLDRPAWKDD